MSLIAIYLLASAATVALLSGVFLVGPGVSEGKALLAGFSTLFAGTGAWMVHVVFGVVLARVVYARPRLSLVVDALASATVAALIAQAEPGAR